MFYPNEMKILTSFGPQMTRYFAYQNKQWNRKRLEKFKEKLLARKQSLFFDIWKWRNHNTLMVYYEDMEKSYRKRNTIFRPIRIPRWKMEWNDESWALPDWSLDRNESVVHIK